MCASWKTACPSLICFPVKTKHMLCRLNPRIQRFFFLFLNFCPCSLSFLHLFLLFLLLHTYMSAFCLSLSLRNKSCHWQQCIHSLSGKANFEFMDNQREQHSLFSFTKYTVIDGLCCARNGLLLWCVVNNNGVFNEKDCMQTCWFPLWVKNSMLFFLIVFSSSHYWLNSNKFNKVLFSINGCFINTSLGFLTET